jgi:hypothetical protein
MSDCDTSTDNGHQICSIPYTGTYNINEYIRVYKGSGECTGCYDPSCYDNKSYCAKFNDPYGKITRIREEDILKTGISQGEVFIHKGPPTPFGYLGGTDRKIIDLKNKKGSYPLNEDIKETLNTLILGVEIIPDDVFIGRISGIYYCGSDKITKTASWKGYNEGSGKIDLFEYYRQDIHNDGSDYKGNRNSNGKKTILRGSFGDSVVCGIWYKKMINSDSRNPLSDIQNGNPPAIGLCIAFRRFFDITSPAEYLYFERSSLTKSRQRPNSDWLGSECKPGEFISQIEFYYTDFDKNSVEGKAAVAGIQLFDLVAYSLGVGFKGFGMYRSVDYNVPDGLYKWINDVDSFRCCQLLSSNQYDDDTVEKYVCRENLNRKVTNDFPNSYPNDVCKRVLEGWCNTSYIDDKKEENYNIEDELCSKACNIDDISCDKGIKDYCLSPKFLSGGTGAKYDMSKYMKDPICGCMYSKVARNNELLSNLPLSFSTVLDQKLLSKAGLQGPIREECTLPFCAQSPFKFLSMKKNKAKTPCSEKESCFGNGYVVPTFEKGNTSITCLQFANSDNCIMPIEPNITVVPDPFTSKCKGLLKNEIAMPKFEPTECIYGTKWYPEDQYNARCEMHVDPEDGQEKLMLRTYLQLLTPSIPNLPPGPNNPLCPPKVPDYSNVGPDSEPSITDKRQKVEEWIPCPNPNFNEDESPPKSGMTKIGVSILIFTIIFGLIISLFIKIIKK